MPNELAYVATKWNRRIHIELKCALRHSELTVNAIDPGQPIPDGLDEVLCEKRWLGIAPMQRLGTPGDAAR